MNSSMKTFSSLSMKVCVLTAGHREGRGGERVGITRGRWRGEGDLHCELQRPADRAAAKRAG